MPEPLKVAIIGLDTSHATKFPSFMVDPAVPEYNRVSGLVPTRCLRFETPFQNKDGLDKRQAVLEKLGVLVTEDFDTAVADCDAIMLEINDPTLHLKYFEKCAKLGKPIFLDKPFADTVAAARQIADIAKKNNVRFCTTSALRYLFSMTDALDGISFQPRQAVIWGSLGVAPKGYSYIIWYGIHAFEMLETIMGRGAKTVNVSADEGGFVCHVIYENGRRGVVELCYSSDAYGFVIRAPKQNMLSGEKDPARDPAAVMLHKIGDFFHGGPALVPVDDSLEIMAMLEAAEKSFNSGKPEAVVY